MNAFYDGYESSPGEWDEHVSSTGSHLAITPNRPVTAPDAPIFNPAPITSPATTLLAERGATHGNWTKQSALSQTLKKATSATASPLTSSQRDALDMILVKISRICAGNPNEPDHWADIAGYATLAKNEILRHT